MQVFGNLPYYCIVNGCKALTILWSDEIWQTCPLVSGVGDHRINIA